MIEQLIAEATECDFKVALETKKPKSWLKSVSAFSNGIGGTLFFGVSVVSGIFSYGISPCREDVLLGYPWSAHGAGDPGIAGGDLFCGIPVL